MDGNEIIIEHEEDFITGRVEAVLPEILTWGFDKLKAANKQKQIRQIFLKDPNTKQIYSIMPVREAYRKLKGNCFESQLIDFTARRKRK